MTSSGYCKNCGRKTLNRKIKSRNGGYYCGCRYCGHYKRPWYNRVKNYQYA